MQKKQSRPGATERRGQNGRDKRMTTSHSLTALYGGNTRHVNAENNPQLTEAINGAVMAMEATTNPAERRAWRARVRELERCIPIGRAHHRWWDVIFGDLQ